MKVNLTRKDLDVLGFLFAMEHESKEFKFSKGDRDDFLKLFNKLKFYISYGKVARDIR